MISRENLKFEFSRQNGKRNKVLKEITVVEKKIIDKNDDNFEEQKEERITKQNFASSISNKIIMELSILNDN